MKAPDKGEVVAFLEALGRAKRHAGDAHRARAYLGGANAIARRDDFEALYAAGRLRDIPGIGPAIESKVVAFVERGERPAWLGKGDPGDEERPNIPPEWETAPFRDAPDLHVHTTWSDGTLTLDETLAWAKELGSPAVGITDHSGSLRIARGLRADEVREQWAAIARAEPRHEGIKALRGTECDILRDGRLDHPEELLDGFDFVVGSLHSQLRLDKAEQTKRVLRALDSPQITVLGHPTTRVPNRRPRANLDLARIFRKAADKGIAMEVNGNPGRIDLDVDLAKQALDAGCKLSLASDGHSAWEMLALAVARTIAAEAGATKKDIVNYDVLRTASSSRRPAVHTP